MVDKNSPLLADRRVNAFARTLADILSRLTGENHDSQLIRLPIQVDLKTDPKKSPDPERSRESRG